MWSEGDMILRREVLNDGRCVGRDAGDRRARRAGAACDVHRRGYAVPLPGRRLADADGRHPWHGRDALGGPRRADAAAPGRGARDLGLLARPRARVRRLVREPAGAVPPHRRRATTRRISSSTSGSRPTGRGSGRTPTCSTSASARAGTRAEQVAATVGARAARVAAELDAGRRWWDPLVGALGAGPRVGCAIREGVRRARERVTLP